MKTKIILAGLAAFSNPTLAATHQVTSVADSGPRTLRAAIAAAVSGDSIIFAPWLYGERILLDTPISIDKTLHIKGDMDQDNLADITLDGQDKSQILTIGENGNVTIWSMAFEHGRSDGDGGAIHNSGQLYLHHTTFEDNLAQRGGAIYSVKKLVIDTSTLRDNVAMQGGGAIQTRLKARFAAIPQTYVMNSTFASNRAKIDGGAIRNAGHLTINASTFSHNLAATGLTTTTTSTQNRGSAIWTFTTTEYTTKIYDSTFVGNKSHPMTTPNLPGETASERMDRHQNHGATIYNHTVSSHASVLLARTVIAKSQGRNCGGSGHFITDHSWSDDTTCAKRDEIGTNSGNPKLLALGDHGGYTLTHFPKQDSGLVNAGGNDCAEYDQRGARRYYSKPCDIGAVERAPAAPMRPVPIQIDKTIPDEYVDTHITRGELAKLIGNKDAIIAEKQAEVEAKSATIAEKQAEIDAKSTTIAEKQAEIEEKAAMIAEKQAEIESKSATIAEKTALIATLNGQLVDLNAQLTSLDEQLEAARGNEEEVKRLQGLITEKEAQIDQHQARIAELEAPDALDVEIGDAGLIKNLSINGDAVLYASTSDVIVTTGDRVIQLADTVTDAAHTTGDGSTVSQGWFMGDNGMVQWVVRSRVIPKTNFHVSRWEFSSTAAFGNLRIGIHTDVDIDIDHPSDSALIVGGDGHPNRLLVTDSTTPSEGVSQGLRWLKNARRIGWLGTETGYCDQCSDALSDSRLTGPSTDWPTFTPDQDVYPGAHGYGPMDVAITMGLALKPSAKLASFETTIVGAPNGHIE
ncbi:choice-of-anchor Q domain-containing protein [Thiolapillus sp.]|uniref:choice-of-anchor Q domain-containing protein n=1 Tax=Thiolapillus sp. TaxID=2017437 RepID=UPI003AF88861